MGKFSRTKGRRGEQELVLYLAKLGYKAERILNQAHTAGLADVLATKDGVSYTFEHKSYRSSFKTIYALFERWKDLDGVMRFCLKSGECAAVSKDFKALLKSRDVSFRHVDDSRYFGIPEAKELKVFNRIIRLNEMRGKADYLVIKDNNYPRLFIQFWV